MNSDIFNEVSSFLEQIVDEITSVGIDVSKLDIDHIAYSTNTTEEYETLRPLFIEIGNLEKEAIISNRRVAVIKFLKPLEFGTHFIPAVELIEPKEGQEALSGWEHVEFLVENYEDVLKTYPNLDWDTNNMNRENFSRIKLTLPSKREVKFLDTPVLESVKKEK